MNTQTKILIGLLAIFVVGMTMGAASAAPSDVKIFKSPSGYEWEIKSSTWENMKQQAKDKYKEMREIGSHTPGYSDQLHVTVTKDGVKYEGIAFAVKNDNGIRCEVRGAAPDGERLTSDEIQKS